MEELVGFLNPQPQGFWSWSFDLLFNACTDTFYMCTAFEKIEETSIPAQVNTLVNMFVLNPSEPEATLPVMVSKHFMGHIEQKIGTFRFNYNNPSNNCVYIFNKRHYSVQNLHIRLRFHV